MEITKNLKIYGEIESCFDISVPSQANFLYADLVEKNENVTFIKNAISPSGRRNCGPLRHFIYYRSSQVSFVNAPIIF